MGKTSILFKKIGDSKGKFHARRGMIKDKTGKDLTEREGIKVAKIHRRTISSATPMWWSVVQSSFSGL